YCSALLGRAEFPASLFEKLARSRLGRDVSVAESDPPCLAERNFWQASLRSLPSHGLAVTSLLQRQFRPAWQSGISGKSRLGRDVSVAETDPPCLAERKFWQASLRSLPSHGLAVTSLLQRQADFLASLFEKLAKSRLGRDFSVHGLALTSLLQRRSPAWQSGKFWQASLRSLPRHCFGRDVSVAETCHGLAVTSLLQRQIRPAWQSGNPGSLFEKLAKSQLGRD
ncbi:unnamed protein product, partial [Polarella glacialis]